MNIIFMGTPDFAIPSLTLLLASDNTLAGVVTQPDRPRGRGKQLKPPPVKALAQQHGLPDHTAWKGQGRRLYSVAQSSTSRSYRGRRFRPDTAT